MAPSALLRLLRERNVVVKDRTVSDAVARSMAKEYDAGATMRELESKYGRSHGAVYRALHRADVETRGTGRRRKSA